MSNLRKFKLRNGIIVEEWPDHDGCNYRCGFPCDYRVLEPGDHDCVSRVGWLCLLLPDVEGELPTGGAHGTDFDIVEEIFKESSDD